MNKSQLFFETFGLKFQKINYKNVLSGVPTLPISLVVWNLSTSSVMAETPAKTSNPTTKPTDEHEDVVLVKVVKGRTWKAFSKDLKLAYAKLASKHGIFSRSKYTGSQYAKMKAALLVDTNLLHVQWGLKEITDGDTNFTFFIKKIR